MNTTIGLADFLALFVPVDADGFLELRAKTQPGPREFIRLSQPNAADRLFAYIVACEQEQNHSYFGVAERATDTNGKKENLSWLRVLYADCDFKDSSEAETRQRIDEFPLPPSVLVESGGGLYPFWLLREPVDLRAEGAIARVEALIRRVVNTLHADGNATDVTRMLRLPCTQNRKYDPPRPVQITIFQPQRRYTQEQFEGLDALLPDPRASARATPRRQSFSIGVQNPEKIVNVLSVLWPDNGLRHQFAKHLGGWLAHRSVALEDALLLVRRAAEAANDDDVEDRIHVVQDSYNNMVAGRTITGLTSALEIVPEMRDVVDMLNEALGVVPRPIIVVEPQEEEGDAGADRERLVALPAQARLGIAKQYADLYAEAYEAPWENFYFAFLTHLGARVAKHLRLDNDLGTEPRLYSILLAPSGAGKSEAINKATADFAWADLGHAADPLKPAPGQFSVVHGVGSGEALGEALEEDDRRTVLFQPDEFAHVANKMKIEGSSLTSILNTLFENAAWDNRVRGKKYKIEGASLSFLTACVDDVFPTLFDPRGGADQGIVNRFWIVAGPSSAEPKPSPRVDPVALGQIRQRLHQILRPFQSMGREEHMVVRCAPEARALYEDWYRNEYFQQRGASLVRLRTYVQRFTMLLALSTTEGVILSARGLVAGPEVVRAAITMARWQGLVRQRFMPIIADNAGAKVEMTILRVFRQTGGQGLTRRDAQRLTSASRVGTATWNRAFDALCVNGNLVPLEPLPTTPSEKGGRPQSPRFRLAFSD